MDIEEIFKVEKHTVWDLPVPIITKGSHTTAYLTTDITMPDMYNELCYRISSADKDETIKLIINTPGGVIDSAFMIIDAIKNSEARVVAHLTGTVASAGTLIAMACDDITVSNHLAFMAHNYSGGISGKGHEMKARQEFNDKSLNKAFKFFYAGFYNEDEMEEIIDGKDSWISSEEVLERWANRKTYLAAQASE